MNQENRPKRIWPNGEKVKPATQEQLELVRKECTPFIAVIDLMLSQLDIKMPVSDMRWNYLLMRDDYVSWKASLGRFGAMARCPKEMADEILDVIYKHIRKAENNSESK